MNVILTVLSLILSYLAGSIPTSVWAGKMFHGIDVREHGSGNAGATNTVRVLGWKTGIPVLIIDLAKGWLAASLPVFFNIAPHASPQLTNLMILCGLAAMAGHIYPVFAGFRGGKGVATTFGVLFALNPWLTLACAGIFLVVFLISGYVSLSSMIAGMMFPVLLLLVFKTPSLFFKIFSIVIAVALILTHTENIRRLLKGEEKKLIRKTKN